MQLKEYKFDKYFTKKDKEETPTLKLMYAQEGADLKKSKEDYAHKDAMVQGIAFAKDLIPGPQTCCIP